MKKDLTNINGTVQAYLLHQFLHKPLVVHWLLRHRLHPPTVLAQVVA